MYIALTFPLVDLRSLHPHKLGRLEKPRWGDSDPLAQFARGFGAIHFRNKSSIGYSGENFYADCNRLIRYPQQHFISSLAHIERETLFYPIYRRFYFDGRFSGRFELAFRMNEASIWEINQRHDSAPHNAVKISRLFQESPLEIDLLDGRKILTNFLDAVEFMRDGYLMSTTKSSKNSEYPISESSQEYVKVGVSFVTIRSSPDTPLLDISRKRVLISKKETMIFLSRSGVPSQYFDTLIIASSAAYNAELPCERIARLIYNQVRCIVFAQAFYCSQIDNGKLPPSDQLQPAISAMLRRIQDMRPAEGDEHDAAVCKAAAEILAKADVNPGRLAQEINSRLKIIQPTGPLGRLLNYFDKKLDVAIGAAAAAATKEVLRGGS